MNWRPPLFRVLAIIWASLHLAVPAASAVADGLLARDSGAEQFAHVESATTSKCPVVHAPDCGVCRYLSTCGAVAVAAAPAEAGGAGLTWMAGRSWTAAARPRLLPDGRAPPQV